MELETQLLEDLGNVRLAKRPLERRRFRYNTLIDVTLDQRAPEVVLPEVAELLGTSSGVAAQALELGVDGDDLYVESNTLVDRANFDAPFAATLCQVHAGSRNRPSEAYCAGR